MAPMPRTPPFDLSTLILAGLALTLGLVASRKDPGFPVSVPLLVVLANSGMALHE
jgi:hypothetical protein